MTSLARVYLAALRSGLYKQIRGRLFSRHIGEECYCALGVAGKVAGMEPHETYAALMDTENDCKYVLPKWVLDELGLTPNQALIISVWNDDCRLSLTEIADKIEKEIYGECQYKNCPLDG